MDATTRFNTERVGALPVIAEYLEKPNRIAGMMQILLWALMALSLMERDVRKSLNGQPMYGIYPENRPCPAPTGRGILECFEELTIVVIKHKTDAPITGCHSKR